MQRAKLFGVLFAYVNNIQITWKTIHLSVFCRANSPSTDQNRAEEIIQNMLERKDLMAECYQRASERACVTFPLFVFGQGTTFFFSYGYL